MLKHVRGFFFFWRAMTNDNKYTDWTHFFKRLIFLAKNNTLLWSTKSSDAWMNRLHISNCFVNKTTQNVLQVFKSCQQPHVSLNLLYLLIKTKTFSQ